MDLSDLIDAYRGPLVGLIASWGVPWADATELAQDSFSEAWLRRESCRGDWTDAEIFGRWLRGVALNQYRNWARGRRRRLARVMTLSPTVLDGEAARPTAIEDERLAALRAAIQRLPARQREVILMHYLEETTVKDVAALLSVSVKTVEGRLYQARRALHRLLDEGSPSRSLRIWLCLLI
jgi:RNA polymerase sigma factor (sigma-70 family)